MRLSLAAIISFLLLTAALPALAQQPDTIYDEAKIPPYELPDPLKMENGAKVTSAEMWRKKRRPEIFQLFETQVFGRAPGKPPGLRFEVANVDEKALGGKATRKEVTIFFTGKSDGPTASLLLYLPNERKTPAPLFLGLNFRGNHAIHDDPGITLNKSWHSNNKDGSVENNKATEKSRGAEKSRWSVEMAIARGYGVGTIYYGDIDPDFHGERSWKNGVQPSFYKEGQTEPAADEWGSIGAWAWGLSRALDYLETDKNVDAKHVAVLGHSRLGKTSLWAGAADERFAIVISNNSGAGGAALSRRVFGETTGHLNKSFPHWFCGNYKKYSKNEAACPVDHHELIALIAPRPVYVASAEEDRWADPKGEFLSCLHAAPVYKLLGTDGISQTEFPKLSQPITSTVGYHIRPGAHDVTAYDWECFLNFADKHWKK